MQKNNNLPVAGALLLLTLLLAACEGDGGGKTESTPRNDFDYRPLASADLAEAKSIVNARNLSPQDVEIVHQDDFDEGHTITIVGRTVESITHYGAIVAPREPARVPLPVIVLADGQGNPAIDIDVWLARFWDYNTEMQAAITVIPAFRSRTLQFRGRSWRGSGAACDDFDGAATDTLALINAAQVLFPEGDFEHYLVRGHSRGGNTALLLSERDSRVAVAIASGMPVDFYRYSMWVDSRHMYECHFLTGKTATESRIRMLNSSPVYFAEDVHGIIDIHQGSLDAIAHPWNAEIMVDALLAADKDVQVYYYDKGHGDIWEAPALGERINGRMREFLEPYVDH